MSVSTINTAVTLSLSLSWSWSLDLLIEDTKGVVRIRKSKDIQPNGQKKEFKNRSTNKNYKSNHTNPTITVFL